jgi:hypothetical protein
VTDSDKPSLVESLDAAAGPLRRLGAISAQIKLSPIPADAGCHCLCSIYEPHTCDGFRADGCVRKVPGDTLFGRQLPDVEVHVCRSCFNVQVRTG